MIGQRFLPRWPPQPRETVVLDAHGVAPLAVVRMNLLVVTPDPEAIASFTPPVEAFQGAEAEVRDYVSLDPQNDLPRELVKLFGFPWAPLTSRAQTFLDMRSATRYLQTFTFVNVPERGP